MKNNFKVFSLFGSQAYTGSIASQLSEKPGKMVTQTFSDGEINVVFDESIRGEIVVLVAQVQLPYHNLFELFIAIDAARRASAKEIICVIPYLPHSRQERKDDTRSAISSRLIADFLEHAGADRIITLDMHSTAIMGFYKIPIDHLSMHNNYIDHIKTHFDLKNLCLCSPDFGGLKRIKAYKAVLNCDMAVIHKERLSPNKIDSMEIIGDVKGKDVVIVDDMIDTGGTLCKASEIIKQQGARSVNAYCTHGVLSGNAMENIERSGIDHLYISDTVPQEKLTSKIQVVSSIELVSKAIRFIIDGKSLKELF
jgi:ribose-phosphate pyrophosphokinase